jgi:hypothetical protein
MAAMLLHLAQVQRLLEDYTTLSDATTPQRLVLRFLVRILLALLSLALRLSMIPLTLLGLGLCLQFPHPPVIRLIHSIIMVAMLLCLVQAQRLPEDYITLLDEMTHQRPVPQSLPRTFLTLLGLVLCLAFLTKLRTFRNLSLVPVLLRPSNLLEARTRSMALREPQRLLQTRAHIIKSLPVLWDILLALTKFLKGNLNIITVVTRA